MIINETTIYNYNFLTEKTNSDSWSFLDNFDPSKFQSVILGILAIFIPFAIVFLTDILNSKKDNSKSDFEKIVLNDEVFETAKIFGLTAFSLGLFSFFDEKSPNFLKFISIIIIFITVFYFWFKFKKVLKFSEGDKIDFEISFLKKKSFKFFCGENKILKVIRAWESFWSDKTEYHKEKEFTEIFIKHIDQLIKNKKFQKAIELAQTYLSHIEKRNVFWMGDLILPKVLEWNETLWQEERIHFKNHKKKTKLKKKIIKNWFPKFIKQKITSIFNKLYNRKEYFWNYNYFEDEFFQKIIKIMMKDRHGVHQLFGDLKDSNNLRSFIIKSEKKLNKIEDGEEREYYVNFIEGVMKDFCFAFFDNINEISSGLDYDIWKHNIFPKEWKCESNNYKNIVSKVVFNNFMEWVRDKIRDKNESGEYNENLTRVVNGLFPNGHPDFFVYFIILFFNDNIKYVLEAKPNFCMLNTMISYSGKKSDKKIGEMRIAKENFQVDETIKIILSYFVDFYKWHRLVIYTTDLTEEEKKKAEENNNNIDKEVVEKVRIKKLKELKKEFETPEIIEFCKKKEGEESDIKEHRRKSYIELINLLIKELEKQLKVKNKS